MYAPKSALPVTGSGPILPSSCQWLIPSTLFARGISNVTSGYQSTVATCKNYVTDLTEIICKPAGLNGYTQIHYDTKNSMLDSGAEGPGFKSQPRCSLRQTVHNHRASVHQAAKLVAPS